MHIQCLPSTAIEVILAAVLLTVEIPVLVAHSGSKGNQLFDFWRKCL